MFCAQDELVDTSVVVLKIHTICYVHEKIRRILLEID